MKRIYCIVILLCSDGVIRVFTSAPERTADNEDKDLKEFDDLVKSPILQYMRLENFAKFESFCSRDKATQCGLVVNVYSNQIMIR